MKDKPAVHRRVHNFSSFLFAKLTQHGLTQGERLTDALKFSQTQVMQSCVKSDAGCFQLPEWHTRAESHQLARAHAHEHTGFSRLRKTSMHSVSHTWLSLCLHWRMLASGHFLQGLPFHPCLRKAALDSGGSSSQCFYFFLIFLRPLCLQAHLPKLALH